MSEVPLHTVESEGFVASDIRGLRAQICTHLALQYIACDV